MPNWCNNSVTISGPRKKVEDLWYKAQELEEVHLGLLSAMVPLKEGETGVSKWGTKWDIESTGLQLDVNLKEDTATISGWFDSAWSPPVECFETFSTNNQEFVIELFYHEPGMCFVGYWSSEDGDDYYEYSEFSSKNICEHVPDYLIEEFDLETLLEEYEEYEEEV